MSREENKMQESVANILRLELMDKCNCPSGLEVMFFCKSSQCRDHAKQKYYCYNCSQEDGKHDHKPLGIVKELESQVQKWHDFNQTLTMTHTEGAKRYKAMEPLIRYIEEAMMDPDATFVSKVEWISVKHDQLEKVYKEGTKVYNEKVKPLMVGAKLLELIALNPDFDRLTAGLKECTAI
jgi:hypothetical protein